MLPVGSPFSSGRSHLVDDDAAAQEMKCPEYLSLRHTDDGRATRSIRKFSSNLTRGLLLTEHRLAGALPNLANALRASSLEARLREVVVLRVAALQQSAYERMQHLGQARKVGWSDEEIAAIEAGGDAVRDPKLRTILSFVDACVAGPEMSDQIFAAASEVVSHRDLATVILLVAHYMMVARLIGVLQIELEEHPDS